MKIPLINEHIKAFKELTTHSRIIILCLSFNSLATMSVSLLSIYLSSIVNIPFIKIGIILSAIGIGNVFGALCGGKLARSGSIIIFLSASFVFEALAYLSFSIADLYFISALFLGLFQGLCRTLGVHLLMASNRDKNRVIINSIRRTSLNVSLGLGVFVGGYLLHHFQFVIFYLSFGFAFLAGSLLYFNKDTIPVVNIPSDKSKDVKSKKIFFSQLSIDKNLLLTLSSLFLVNLVFFQTTSTYALYLINVKYLTSGFYGNLFLLNSIVIVLLEIPLMMYMKKINLFYSLAFAALMICFGIAIISAIDSKLAIMFSCMLWTIGEMIYFSSALVALLNISSKENEGSYISLYQAIISGTMIVAPIFGIYVYKQFSPEVLWISCALIGVISSVILLVLGYINAPNKVVNE